MTPDGFLTFAGLLIAAYAALSDSARLRIRSQLLAQSIVAAVLIAPAFLVLFLPTDCGEIKALQLGCNYSYVSFFLVTAWIFLAYLTFRYSPPTAFGMRRLESHVEDLISQRKFGELCSFIEPFIEVVFLGCERRLPLQFARASLLKYSNSGLNLLDSSPPAFKPPAFIKLFMKCFASILPTRNAASESAGRIIALISVSDDFLDHCVISQPTIVCKFLLQNGYFVNDINQAFLRKLYTNKDSILLRELRRVDSMEGMHFWRIPEGCKILPLMPGDPTVVIENLAWKPIGDAMIEEIETDSETQRHLRSRQPTDDTVLFRFRLMLGVHFFNLMVNRAVKYRIKDHMWLMYMSIFVEKILATADMNLAELDVSAEFPNLGARILHEITHVQSNWIDLSKVDSKETPYDFADHSSLFYWAISDYCETIRIILRSANATRRFKEDRLESFVRLLERFPREDNIRVALCNHLVFGSPHSPENHIATITDYFSGIDHVRRFNAPDLASLLRSN